MVLSTDRLFLRTWDVADLGLARSLWGDRDVMAFLGGPLSDEKVLEKMRAEMVCLEQHGVQYWPAFEQESDEFIGCCGLRPWAYTPPDGYEIGFHVLKSKWGNGYALEAAQGVVTHAFDTLRLSVLRTGHHPENDKSKRILLKLGFRRTGEVFYAPTRLMHPTYELRNQL